MNAIERLVELTARVSSITALAQASSNEELVHH